ncbi:gallidermin family lantibiotic [Vibrio coralliilyticus]|nr:gallidermin family lantibiotic [Vibrio coralliilyticus]
MLRSVSRYLCTNGCARTSQYTL